MTSKMEDFVALFGDKLVETGHQKQAAAPLLLGAARAVPMVARAAGKVLTSKTTKGIAKDVAKDAAVGKVLNMASKPKQPTVKTAMLGAAARLAGKGALGAGKMALKHPVATSMAVGGAVGLGKAVKKGMKSAPIQKGMNETKPVA